MSVCPGQGRLVHCLVNLCLCWGLLGLGTEDTPPLCTELSRSRWPLCWAAMGSSWN